MNQHVETYAQFINEELVIDTLNYGIYRNPKSIKRMNPWKRAISDEKGDIYVLDDPFFELVHGDMVRFLNEKGIIESSSNYESILHNFVAWTQVGNQNTFYLSESYNTKNISYWNSLKFFGKHVNKFTKIVMKKNPQFKYVKKRIWDTFEQPKSDKEMKRGNVIKK